MTALQLQHANLVENARANREAEAIRRRETAIKEAQATRDVALDQAKLTQLGYQTAATAASYGDLNPAGYLAAGGKDQTTGSRLIADLSLSLQNAMRLFGSSAAIGKAMQANMPTNKPAVPTYSKKGK
jgi:hypothetical protein